MPRIARGFRSAVVQSRNPLSSGMVVAVNASSPSLLYGCDCWTSERVLARVSARNQYMATGRIGAEASGGCRLLSDRPQVGLDGFVQPVGGGLDPAVDTGLAGDVQCHLG